MDHPGALVDPTWLKQNLADPRLVVLDAGIGADREQRTRILGARVFDIDHELSDADSPFPHTMPSARAFEREVRRMGIDDDSVVIAYDATGIYSSPRAWWMFLAMGFDQVSVLDGGLPGWIAAGGAVQDGETRSAHPGRFTARPRPELFVDADQVELALADPDAAVLDARSRGRFAGTEPEPRPGLRCGHMPGALNVPWSDLVVDGFMRPVDELAARLAPAGDAERIVCTCGSGVTACVVALAAHLVGRPGLAVYDGSWSEWGLPSQRSVRTE